MKKYFLSILCTSLTLFIGSMSCANSGYTQSIRMRGNNVEYNHVENKVPDEPKEIDTSSDKKSIQYFSVTPYNNYWPAYQQGYWGYYPSTSYNSHYYYGKGPIVYTYSSTGIKTGPDGRVITPLMERDMYNYHMPPASPPHINVNPSFHRPHRPHYGPHHRF